MHQKKVLPRGWGVTNHMDEYRGLKLRADEYIMLQGGRCR